MKRVTLALALAAAVSGSSPALAQRVISSYVIADSEAVEKAAGGTLFVHLVAHGTALSASELTVQGRPISEWRAQASLPFRAGLSPSGAQ